MSSSYKTQGIFNSGPHRFRVLAEGELVVANSRLDPMQPGSVAVGPLELVVVVTGRLVAVSESALWTLRDAIGDLLTDPPQVGSLVDHHGHTWADMSFTRFQTDDRTDRGRLSSIAYRATFIRFLAP